MTSPLKIFLAVGIFSVFTLASHLASAQVNVTTQSSASTVTLVWEADTYVPPFYKGKALYVDGADARILALPRADLGDPSSLVYVWKINGRIEDSASGAGRNYFVFRPDVFGGSPLIVAEVYKDTEKVAVGAVRVPQVEPEVVIYPELPLAGILFGNTPSNVEGDEITLEAYPLFFSARSKQDPALTYRWNINDERVANPSGNTGRLVLRSEAGGAVRVDALINNTRRVLEDARGTVSLTFEE